MQEISHYLDNINIVTYVAVFLGGVLTSFTPCVFPLVPIIVGVIGGSKQTNKMRNFILSLFYVLGLALTFSILGVIAALSGRIFGQFQSSSLAHIIVGGAIIVFSLALLGVVSLPVHLLSRVGVGKKVEGNNVFSIFLMGATSGLIAAPCATAVIGALLAFVASTKNAVVGFSLLFVFALGLGTLLVLVGTFAGIMKALPRSEKFIKFFEKSIAFVMLGLGCYFIFKAGALSV